MARRGRLVGALLMALAFDLLAGMLDGLGLCKLERFLCKVELI